MHPFRPFLFLVQKLQRYIAESRKEDPDRVPLEILRASGSRDETVRSGDESIVHNKTQRQNGQNAGSNQAQPDAKRKYRRHPKVFSLQVSKALGND